MKDYPGIGLPVGRTRKQVKGRKQRAASKVVKAVRAAVVARDKGCCRSCGCLGREAHHILPRSRGGKWTTDNILLLCRRCHRSIHDGQIAILGDADGALYIVAIPLEDR